MADFKINGTTFVSETGGTLSIDASQIKVNGTAVIGAATGFMFRNLLYNGAMQINQRGNVSNSSGNAYGCDRWQIVRAGGVGNAVYDLKQSTDVPSGQPFKNSFHLDITTAETSIQNGGGYQFRQQLEGYDVQRLMKGTSSAKSLTLSFWVKSPKTGTHIPVIKKLLLRTYKVFS